MTKPVGTHSDRAGNKLRIYAQQKYFQHGGILRPVSDISVTEADGQYTAVLDDEYITFEPTARKGVLIRRENSNGHFGDVIKRGSGHDDVMRYKVAHTVGVKRHKDGWQFGDSGVGMLFGDWPEERRALIDAEAAINVTDWPTEEINLDPTVVALTNTQWARGRSTIAAGEWIDIVPEGTVDATEAYFRASGDLFMYSDKGSTYWECRRPQFRFQDLAVVDPNTEYTGTLTLTAASTFNGDVSLWRAYQTGNPFTGTSIDRYNLLSPGNTIQQLTVDTSGDKAIGESWVIPVTFTSDAAGSVSFGCRGKLDVSETEPTDTSSRAIFVASGAGEPVLEITEGGGTRRTLTGAGL